LTDDSRKAGLIDMDPMSQQQNCLALNGPASATNTCAQGRDPQKPPFSNQGVLRADGLPEQASAAWERAAGGSG